MIKMKQKLLLGPDIPFHVITWRTYVFPMIHLTQIRLCSPVVDDVINIRTENRQNSTFQWAVKPNRETDLGWNIK